jgi:hypothetical protein
VLAVVVLAPLASKAMPESAAQDLANHVSGIIEARNALAEGQFPVRVAPRQNNGERYPIFQFYGNLPYTAGALFYRAGLNPYEAWKVTVGLVLALGGFFTYRWARWRTRQCWPALVAGAVFMTAPYTLCDLHGRAAYPELFSLGLLPVVFYYLSRTLAAPRLAPLLAGAVAWSCLCLSHAITYFLASLFFGLYTLSFLAPTRKAVRRLLYVGGSYALGLALSAWYVAPQLYLLPRLAGGLASSVGKASWLTPLGVLLAPTLVPPVFLPTILIYRPLHFGLQVGWPTLAALSLVVFALVRRRPAIAAARGTGARLVLVFGLSFFVVWSPFDFWKWLPPVFGFVQFSYRVLMFTVLWGALLSAQALAVFFRGRMTFEHTVACTLLLGLFVSPYLGPYTSPRIMDIGAEIAHPEIGRGGANAVYLLSPAVQLANMERYPPLPDHVPALLQSGDVPIQARPGLRTYFAFTTPGPRYVQLPSLYYPKVLDVHADGKRVFYGNHGRFLALNLPAGDHVVTVRFVGLRPFNVLSQVCWLGVLGGGLVLVGQRLRGRKE